MAPLSTGSRSRLTRPSLARAVAAVEAGGEDTGVAAEEAAMVAVVVDTVEVDMVAAAAGADTEVDAV